MFPVCRTMAFIWKTPPSFSVTGPLTTMPVELIKYRGLLFRDSDPLFQMTVERPKYWSLSQKHLKTLTIWLRVGTGFAIDSLARISFDEVLHLRTLVPSDVLCQQMIHWTNFYTPDDQRYHRCWLEWCLIVIQSFEAVLYMCKFHSALI